MKLFLMIQLTIGNPIQFTEIAYVAYIEAEITEVRNVKRCIMCT